MKKALSILCCLALMLALTTACTAEKPSTTSNDKKVVETTSPTNDTATPEPTDSGTESNNGSALQQVVESAQSSIGTATAAFNGMLDMTITAEGDNKMVYTYTILDESLPMGKAEIEASMDSQDEMMTNLLQQLESVGISSPVIAIRWLDVSGTEIFSKEYKN